MKQLIFTLTFTLVLFSCKTAEEVKSSTVNKGIMYAIGQGGGFTGEYTEFILGEDGKVYKYDFLNDREVFFKNMNKVDLEYFMSKIESMGLDGIEMNAPGNISYYIDVREGRTSINKILWGQPNYSPDKEIVNFHKELFNNLKQWE